MSRFWSTALLSMALIAPISLTPTQMRADDHRYHDKEGNDDHEWNQREDRAYRIWVKENHRKNVNFEKLKDEDRESYWRWRHQHSDAELKINIR
jgi:hypothetical protein